jgi:L-threonylcarbamoyladenylate synthase
LPWDRRETRDAEGAKDPRLRPADTAGIAAAAAQLRAGGLVAFPTETVYGLGADATCDRAVAEIFAAKGRPRFNPLIVHFSGIDQAAEEVVLDDRARRLARRFWPGALTLVLRRSAHGRVSLLCSAGLPSLAVRLPAHPTAQALIAAAGCPLAAPSANAYGTLSPTEAGHVARSLAEPSLIILDGGATPLGLESTVVDLSEEGPPRLLRPGGVTDEALAAEIGPLARPCPDAPHLKSPGMLASHYAPRCPLRLAVEDVAADEALVAFGPQVLPGAAETRNLSPSGDLTEAAAQLFAALHALDRPKFRAIAVMPIPERGLGVAINDRLRRASVRGSPAAQRPAE